MALSTTYLMEDQRLPSDGPTRPVSAASRPPQSELDVTGKEDRVFTPYKRLAIVTGILLPIATIPYILSKRRMFGLQRRCEELNFKVNVVQRQLNASFSQLSMLKDEQARMRALLHDVKQRTDDLEQNARQHALEQTRRNEMMRSDLRRTLEEIEQMR